MFRSNMLLDIFRIITYLGKSSKAMKSISLKAIASCWHAVETFRQITWLYSNLSFAVNFPASFLFPGVVIKLGYKILFHLYP